MSARLLPADRDLYNRHPEYRLLEPWELQHVPCPLVFGLYRGPGLRGRDRGRLGGCAPGMLGVVEGGVSEAPSYEDIVHALRLRCAGMPQLQDQPARDIGHDLMANGYLPTEPDPALVRRALVEIKDEGGAA